MPEYTYECVSRSGMGDVHYRIRNAADNRVATCYLEADARLVVRLMNAGQAATELLTACEAVLEFLGQKVPDGQEMVPLAQRLAAMGGLFTERRLQQAIARAKGETPDAL